MFIQENWEVFTHIFVTYNFLDLISGAGEILNPGK